MFPSFSAPHWRDRFQFRDCLAFIAEIISFVAKIRSHLCQCWGLRTDPIIKTKRSRNQKITRIEKSAAGPGLLLFFSSGAWRRRSTRTSRYKDGLCAKIEVPPSLFNLGGKCIANDIRCSFVFQLLIDATDFNSVIALPLLQRSILLLQKICSHLCQCRGLRTDHLRTLRATKTDYTLKLKPPLSHVNLGGERFN